MLYRLLHRLARFIVLLWYSLSDDNLLFLVVLLLFLELVCYVSLCSTHLYIVVVVD